MKNKVLSLFLLVVMMATLSVAALADNKAEDEVVTLKWVMVGSGMSDNYDAWQKNINSYLEEKIGVHIDVQIASWGDWENRRNIIVNSGEYFDILFTDGSRYLSEVKLGVFKDITKLVKENASELYEYIPAKYWDAVKVDNKIYSIPTYKDSSMTNYIVWDKVIADKYNVDYENLVTLNSLSSSLKKIKEGENTAPFVLDKNGLKAILSQYDNLGSGLVALGVRVDDQSHTVVNVLQEEEVLNNLEILHQWYKDGIVNADAPILTQVPDYRMCYIAQGWSSAAKTTWGPNMGTEAVAIQYTEPIVSNGTVRGSLNAIYSGSRYPKKALEFLQLVNLDPYVRDSFYYGLEGDNFIYTDQGELKKLNSEWKMAGYTQGTFFTLTPLAGREINQWDEVKQLNAEAKGSVMLGFNLDTSNIENELANCLAVYNKYRSILLTGAKEPRQLVDTITKELKIAGFDKIMEETQKQIDAAYNK